MLFFLVVCVFFSGIIVQAGNDLYSPNKKIGVSWDNSAKELRVIYKKGDASVPVVQLKNIGLQLQPTSGDEFNYVSSSAVTSIREDYTMITGKRRHCTNKGNQQVFHFKNGQKRIVGFRNFGCMMTVLLFVMCFLSRQKRYV